MRTLFLLLALCGAGYCFYYQHELFSPPVFRETRISTHLAGRELSLVTVEEVNGMSRCENEAPLQQFADLCQKGLSCSTTSVECKKAVSTRYLAMLNQTQQNNKYLHVQSVTSDRRAIYTLWGLNSFESNTLCQQWISTIYQDQKLRDNNRFNWRCI